VQFVTRSRDGSLWVATAGGGLDRLRAGETTFEHFRHDPHDPSSLSSDNLLTIHEDRAGTLWIGTADRGLDERCAGCSGFRHHRYDPVDPDSLVDETVSDVLETRAGELWVGTRAGLLRYDREGERFDRFAARIGDPQAPASDSISTLAEDSLGNLWIGTQGGGINQRLVDASGKARFAVIDSHSGLAADAIGAMVEDAHGRIWVSTTVGISRIDQDGGIVNLGARDGAQALGYWTNSGARLPDGRIVFGGLGGATLFDPDDVVAPTAPRPLVTSLLLRNVPVELTWQLADSPLATSLWRGREVELAHDQDNVTFEFSAGVFSDPESIRYAYRLDGHDRSWIDTPASRRVATYTDLSPGRYQLRVRARRDGGRWVDAPTIGVRVRPAPWASPFAYSMYGLGLLVLGLLAGLQLRADMRNRRRVQESIRASEERLKLALWGSGSELWDIDLLSGQLHRENQLDHLAATHEATKENIAAYLPFVHPEDMDRMRDAIAAHLKGQVPVFEASYRTRNREHEWVWLLTRGRVVQRDGDGRALRMTGTSSDITALNQALGALRTLNEQLESRVEQRTAALQDANRELRNTLDRLTLAQRQLFESEKLASLGGMVAGIAHEINTPLGVGVTAASHLQEEARRMSRLLDADGAQPEDLARFSHAARESADLILRNLQRADRLVKSFKRVAVDQSSEDLRVVDLGACLDEMLMTLGPTLKKTLHRVELECPPALVVTTAPGALYQIVTNLVMNSLTHGFEPGVAGSIRLLVVRGDDAVTIDYADNGLGMEESVRVRVFEPFFTTRRGQGGSGLGMHIVYSLVTQVLQGHIDCESAPGAGTRFLIRFPAPAQRTDGAPPGLLHQ
jgi:signal transduction histidine kinase/sugar lactone lactonase YvrE